ncbi:AAA family ATPase [Aeromicrobium sp.]|uniref:AAA family ATPase n=1 Tax=Aeromicrobium sp. TaxID=1871063 RepID=UPI003C693366
MTAGPVRVQLLGAFEVRLNGERLDSDRWPGRRAADLVQLLALANGHSLLRDQVVEALWPHLSAAAGAANLRKAAHHARRVLGDPAAVTLQQGHVTLFPGRVVTTDAAEFTAAAEHALAAGDTETARAVAESYPGELLPGSLYDDWTQASRERLRGLHLGLLRLSRQWDQLMESDPTDEEACREVMRQALAAGRRHAAISCYGRLRTSLRVDVGILPSAETDSVYRECIQTLAVAESRLLGRQLELSTVTARLRPGTPGSETLVAVRGPAGIGKSAFCRQMATIATAEGWAAVTTAASRSEGPYAVLIAVIEQIVTTNPGALEAMGQRTRAVLAKLSPLVESSTQLVAPVTRHQVIGAIRRLLTAAAGHRGIVIFVDDAHVADAATLETLFHLGAVAAPILTVLAYRPTAASEILRDGAARSARAGAIIEIDLAPLDRHETRALAKAVGLTDREDILAKLTDLAEGNPFFVLELAKSAAAGGSLHIGHTRRESIAARFSDLDAHTTELLQRLALAGNYLDLATVLALTGTEEVEAFALLDAAISSGVLVVSEGGYRFSHDLVRQSMVDEIAPHHRIAIHRDAARRLAELGGSPGQIARHWLDGNCPEFALPWLLSAASRAVELAAFRDALSYLDPLLGHDPSHAEALLLRATALEALGDPAALQAYARAARAAGAVGAHEIVARQALAQIKQGDAEGALHTLEGAEPVTVAGRLARALTLAGAATLGFGDAANGAAMASQSRRLALESGDSASLVIASWANAAAAHARGDLRGSVQIDLAETQHLPELAVNVFDGQLCITQRLLYGARPYADVIAFADSLGVEAQRIGAARGYAFARTIGGEAKLLAGRLDEAEVDLAAAVRLHRSIAASTGEAFSLQRWAEAALHQGRDDDSRTMLDDALAIAQDSEVGFHLFDRIYGARIVAARTPDAAIAALEAAEAAVLGPDETCPGCRITLTVPAAIAAAVAGDMERAAKYEQATEYLANVVMRLPAWYAALDEVRGHIKHAENDPDASRDHFARAAEVYRRAGQPLDEARCRALATR